MADEKKTGSGRFGGVGGARFGGRDPFFPAGAEFILEIAAVEYYDSKKNKDDAYFKIRGKVLAVAFSPTDFDVETRLVVEKAEEAGSTRGKGTKATEPVKMLRPGQYGVQLINMSHGEAALGDIKNFAAAAYRAKVRGAGGDPATVNPDTFGDEEIDAICDASNPCAGVVVSVRTANKPTQKGFDFTQHFWDEVENFTFSYPHQEKLEG